MEAARRSSRIPAPLPTTARGGAPPLAMADIPAWRHRPALLGTSPALLETSPMGRLISRRTQRVAVSWPAILVGRSPSRAWPIDNQAWRPPVVAHPASSRDGIPAAHHGHGSPAQMQFRAPSLHLCLPTSLLLKNLAAAIQLEDSGDLMVSCPTGMTNHGGDKVQVRI